MIRIRNFSQYNLLLESYSQYGMTQEDYDKSVMKIKRCVSKILMKGGFFGNVLAEIPVGVSKECDFFSTDGTVIIFNPSSVINLSDDEIVWAINQGIIHLALQHFDRKPEGENSLWNEACDIAAEPYLDGIGKSVLSIKYKNPIFLDKSAEEIFRMLQSGSPIKGDTTFTSACEVLEPGEIDKNKISEVIIGDINSIDGGDEKENASTKPSDVNKREKDTEDTNNSDREDKEDSESGEKGDGEAGEDGENVESGESGESGEEGEGESGEGGEPGEESGKDGEEGEGDSGSEWEEGEEENKKDWDPKIEKPKPVNRGDISKKIQEITQRAANKGTGGGGISPALRKFLEDLVNPQVDWRKILQKYVSEADDEITQYKIPNRRWVSRDIYLPGLRGKDEGFGTVVLAVDTSGSIGQDEYSTFLAETRSVLKAFQPKEIYIIYCSDDIDGVDHLKYPGQPLDKSKMGSTGGNELGFDPPIKWTEENVIKKGKDLACLIYFTDGGAHDPEKPKWHRKIIWAMTTSHKMPFGKHVNVPVNKLK